MSTYPRLRALDSSRTPPPARWWSRAGLAAMGIALAVIAAMAAHSTYRVGTPASPVPAKALLTSGVSSAVPQGGRHLPTNLGPVHNCIEYVIPDGDKLGYTPSSWLALPMAQAMAVGEKYGFPKTIQCRGDTPINNSVDIQFHQHLSGGPAKWLSASQ